MTLALIKAPSPSLWGRAARLAMVGALAASLAGCGATRVLRGGDGTAVNTDEADLRISVLSFEEGVQADPSLGAAPPLPAAIENADWSQPGGRADSAMHHLAAQAPFERAWRKSIGEGSSKDGQVVGAPVVAGGVIYAIDADHVVRALELSGGKQLWKTDLGPRRGRDKISAGGGVAVGDGKVFISSGFREMLALSAEDGAELWSTSVTAPFHGAPVYADGRVFATTNDNELFAFDAADGEVQWTNQAIAQSARILTASSPSVAGEAVIAPYASGELSALLVQNGTPLWNENLSRYSRMTSLASINDIPGRPVIDNGVVYAASHSGVIAAIDFRSGQKIWSRTFPSVNTPWIAGGVVYGVTTDGELAAIKRDDGRAYWVTQLQRYKNEKKKKGRIAWFGPIAAGSRLLLTSSEGDFVEVEPETGSILSSRKMGDAFFVPPIAADGAVLLLDDKARLTVLR